MFQLHVLAAHCTLLSLLPFLVGLFQKVAGSNDDDNCFPDIKCTINEFCCDGECCSNFTKNWFAWSVLVVLIFTIIITCLCVPRMTNWTHNTQPVYYHLISPGTYRLYDTTSYQQQPTIPQNNSLDVGKEHLSYQPYRYERLVQQTSPNFNYPEPSAPPKSP